MKNPRKRVTLSLSGEIVARVDQAARRLRTPRSQIVEQWLRASQAQARAEAMDQQWEKYYGALSAAEKSDDEALSRALTRATRRVRIDPGPKRKKR